LLSATPRTSKSLGGMGITAASTAVNLAAPARRGVEGRGCDDDLESLDNQRRL